MSSFLRGHFLVAAKSLHDPNFHKTVVLMLEHNAGGAAGVVLNRPSSIRVAHALSGQFELPDVDEVVHIGGPVEPSALMLLHGSAVVGDSESSPTDGVYIGGSAETFERVLSATDGDADDRIPHRVFCGYAGWGAGQLEGEIARGDWLSHPCSADMVFEVDPYELYERALEQVFADDPLLPYRVKDVSVN